MTSEPDDLDRVGDVFASFEKLVGMIQFQNADACIVQDELRITRLDDPKLQFWRRTYIRTAYAMVEGICYSMRAICEPANKLAGIHTMSPMELNRVLEIPEPGGDKNFIAAPAVVKESFKALARVLHYDFTLGIQSPGYRFIHNTRKVRDRITHPKREEELDVSATELEEARVALRWFVEELDRLHVSHLLPPPESGGPCEI